jgi:protein tyrosine/serine phosphatase
MELFLKGQTLQGFKKAYYDILTNGGPAYKAIFTHIRDSPTEPFIIHCTAGKDRTGVVGALILSLVGVDQNTIATEYSLTEKGLARWMPVLLAKLMSDPALEGNEEAARNMVGAK